MIYLIYYNHRPNKPSKLFIIANAYGAHSILEILDEKCI